MSFTTLGLGPNLCTPLVKLGYAEPTPIQTKAIPLVLTGVDVLARAQTGTGKTAAFGLPMTELLVGKRQRSQPRKPRGLVLVPTRELALQVHRALVTYGAPMQLRVAAIFGGVGMGGQISALKFNPDIVVATPGRLIDHMQRRTVDLSAVEILTLDEADRMLDMGFLPALKQILAALPRNRQTLLFSATLSSEIQRLAADFTREPVKVDVSPEHTVATTVTHRVHRVATEQKRDLLVHVLRQAPAEQALIFCKTKRGSDRVGDYLDRAGIKTAVIHGNKSQNARNKALGDFKAGRVTTLVATDIAARGLDIVQLPLVVNFDLPLVAEDYVHRVGRTGRAGLSGRAVSLVSSADWPLLRDIQRLLPEPIEQVAVEGFAASAQAMPIETGRPAQPSRSQGRPQHQGRRPNGSARRFNRPQDDARAARPHDSGNRPPLDQSNRLHGSTTRPQGEASRPFGHRAAGRPQRFGARRSSSRSTF